MLRVVARRLDPRAEAVAGRRRTSSRGRAAPRSASTCVATALHRLGVLQDVEAVRALHPEARRSTTAT